MPSYSIVETLHIAFRIGLLGVVIVGVFMLFWTGMNYALKGEKK